MTIAELLNAIFDKEVPFWKPQFETWVRSSRRFRTFAETYRDKIRKKLRNVRDDAGLKDLYFELETAYHLLQDQRFTLEYEKYAPLKQRSPDFTAAFRVNTHFNVEVTCIRSVTQKESEPEKALFRKITEAVCDKLGQMPPSIINILLLVTDIPIGEDELVVILAALQEQFSNKQEAIFVRYGFRDAADFRKQFRHLSVVICQGEPLENLILWQNSQAKHPLPKELLNAIQKTFS